MQASLFKTLGHSKRLDILSLLRGHELTVGQIAQMIALRQATVSQHLTLLKRHHLVKIQKIGKEIYYSINPQSLNRLVEYFSSFNKTISRDEPQVIDPICHMHLTPHSARYISEYNGIRHYFCGKGCLRDFQRSHQ